MLCVMSNAVEVANQVKSGMSARLDAHACLHVNTQASTDVPKFSMTNVKLNAQHNVHMLRVGYELARFCRDANVFVYVHKQGRRL